MLVLDKHAGRAVPSVGIQVGKVAEMLEYVMDARRPFTFRDIASATELHRRTAIRYMHALEASGFVEPVGECTQGRMSFWVAGDRLRKLKEGGKTDGS